MGTGSVSAGASLINSAKTRIAILKSNNTHPYSLAEAEGHSIGSVLGTVYKDTENAAKLPAFFNGSISGTTLTVTSMLPGGTIEVGQTLQWAGVSSSEPMIVSQDSGTAGGVGTYTISIDEGTVLVTPMNTDGVIVVPSWAKYVSVVGNIQFPAQVTGDGYCSTHLFRNAGPTPPQGDMSYHTRNFYGTANPSYSSVRAGTGKIPVLIENESWSLRGFQSSSSAQNIELSGNGGKNWLSVEFFES